MTNTGGTPAGWYYAPGDPEGTQRYWDGAQWIGDPQAVQQAAPAPAPEPQPAPQPAPSFDADQTVAYTPPAQQIPPAAGGYSDPGVASAPPNYGGAPAAASPPPSYGAPGAQPGYQQAPAYGAPPAGYQQFGGVGAVGVPAEFGQRAIAYLIDIAPIFALYVVIFVAGAISSTLGAIIGLFGYIAVLGYIIWNMYIVQGKTGQSIGKKQQGIKLVSDANGQPVGGGMAFVRYLCAGAFVLACCIGQFVNLLSPLWNEDKKTYSDKIMKMSVVKA